jgi:proteasome beta subunit
LKHLEGTTTVGLVCKDGTVLVTDTRAVMGYLVASKRARKVYPIADNIGVTVAGGVADTEKLVEILRSEARYYSMREGTLMSVHAAARLTANILHAYRLFPYLAVLLVAGVGADGPKMYFLEFDGSLTEEKMIATGSGSPIAYGVLESEFKEGMTTEEATPIAIKALKAAMKRDISTGNELMVAIITDAGYRELSPEDIKRLA